MRSPKLWVLLILILISELACHQSNSENIALSDNGEFWMLADSARFGEIEEIRSHHRKMALDSIQEVKKFEATHNGWVYQIQYLEQTGTPLEFWVQVDNDSIMISDQYVSHNDLPVYARIRKWTKTGTPFVTMKQFFFKDGKLFYVLEKSMGLENEESPIAAREAPYQESNQSRIELEEEIEKHWHLADSMVRAEINHRIMDPELRKN